jgi:hypothetical protein
LLDKEVIRRRLHRRRRHADRPALCRPQGDLAAPGPGEHQGDGVHDSIYDLFPVNFKVFHKPGSLADVYRRWLQGLPRLVPGQDLSGRLFADWMALWSAAWCPSDLSQDSLGLCDHAPWIDEVVDFDKPSRFPASST